MSDFAQVVGVAMIHYGDLAETRESIHSVLELDPESGHILIIDNSDNIGAVFDGESRVNVVLPGENLGYAGGVNMACQCLTREGMEYGWILNNDLRVSRDSLSQWEAAVSLAPGGDIYGSYVALEDGDCWFGGGQFNESNGAVAHRSFGRPVAQLPTGGVVSTDWINGCSMLIPLSAFARRGPFDETFFLYREELEWQIRAPRAVAYILQEPLVVHRVGQSTGTSAGRLGTVFMARNGAILARRQPNGVKPRWWLHWLWEFILRPLSRMRINSIRHALLGLAGRSKSPRELMELL